MSEEHAEYDEVIREINRSGLRWLLGSLCVLLIGVGGFIWLMNLTPDYDNVTCNGKPMEPGNTCTVVSQTATTTRTGQVIPGRTATLTYEEMAEPDLPGSMSAWVTASLIIGGIGLWVTIATAKGWRADLRNERESWVFPEDEEPGATSTTGPS